MTYTGCDPTRPWYITRDPNGHATGVNQDPALAETPPEDTIAPAWRSATRCRRKRAHPPHTWGGEGYSPFTCTGEAL